MKTKHHQNLFGFMHESFKLMKKRPIIFILILIALPTIYLIVYATGGIKYVYSHTMYITIVLAGIYYGLFFGGLTGLLAGILLGPLMPIDTLTGEMQEPFNWIYRLIMFILIGSIIGYASDKLRKDTKRIEVLMSSNQETKVPNTNYLKKMSETFTSNTHTIIDLLGISLYHELIYQLYVDLQSNCKDGVIITQADSNKLWLVVPKEDLDAEINHLMQLLNKPRQIRQIPLYIDFSVGAVLCYEVGLIKNFKVFELSDTAARHAQVQNLPYFFGDQDKQRKKGEYDLLASFKNALNNGEIYLVYQPKIDLSTMKPYGLEALIRWNHPEKKMIPPDVFIPLVEETKLIHILTDWVLTESLIKEKELIHLGLHIPISINISGKNLYDPQFESRTMSIIKDLAVPVEYIEFELTESTLMVNPQDSKNILQDFANLGIHISLDDYGSGYSSLSYITQFPIRTIKIDRHFMKDMSTNPEMHEIVKSTIALFKTLNYKVVAEGVETMDVVELLKDFECDYAQGYFFAKPMESQKITEWLKNVLNK